MPCALDVRARMGKVGGALVLVHPVHARGEMDDGVEATQRVRRVWRVEGGDVADHARLDTV